jgi:hypothetical protein
MKIKITCPVPEENLHAGLIYDLPDEQAQDLIDQEKAFAIEEPAKARKAKKDGE